MEEKINILSAWFQPLKGTITAFSGGIDSSLVLFLSRKFLSKEAAIGCISVSPSLKSKDYALAVDFCQQHDIHLEVIKTQEIEDENYYTNPANRCFFCKSHLYEHLQTVSDQYPGHIVLNGTNKDDLGDYRPGLQAAKNYEVRSPLSDCGLCKKEVRELAKYLGISHWDKPASPCLSSRVPYGQFITEEKLRQIEAAEEVLYAHGFLEARVRHYGKQAKIEVPLHLLDQLRLQAEDITAAIQALGFEECLIDAEGFVSGKLNRAL